MSTQRALLVGAGSMGRTWARNLLDCPETEIAGWIDIDPNALSSALAELQIEVPFQGTDLRAGLTATRPDFVVDVTTPESHCDTTLAALEFGVPVLGEKPMASSMDEARRMVRASREAGKLYMVSQSRRYNPNIAAYRRAVDRLGRVGILNADFYLGPHFGGFRDAMASPLLVDMAIHTFDQARYLTGADPVSVYCEEFNPAWSWYAGDSSAEALFEMSDGLRFNFRGSWCAEGRNTSWEAEWRAIGARGSGTWNGESDIRGETVLRTEGFMSELEPFAETPDPSQPYGIAGSIRDFLRALDDPSHVPMARCEDNIKSLAMVFGAVESARTGRRVPIAPLLEG